MLRDVDNRSVTDTHSYQRSSGEDVPEIAQRSADLSYATLQLHRAASDPAALQEMTHRLHRVLLADLGYTVRFVQQVLAGVMGSGHGSRITAAGLSEVDTHVDAAIRSLSTADAELCEALDALGPAPGGKPVPSAVHSRQRWRGER
ncbi:hypothetical protein [Amycolatopsis magusensis]|uniref:hypothetical protein n=1 Tax=Amycolatopsis magusensis TaxID=882444 RepID=UPI0037B2E277